VVAAGRNQKAEEGDDDGDAEVMEACNNAAGAEVHELVDIRAVRRTIQRTCRIYSIRYLHQASGEGIETWAGVAAVA
jgi:hypothetical protein